MKIENSNINVSFGVNKINNKDNFQNHIKQNSALLNKINSKGKKAKTKNPIEEMMKEKQQLEESVNKLKENKEKYELEMKIQIDNTKKELADLEDQKDKKLQEIKNDKNHLKEILDKYAKDDKDKDKNLKDLNKENDDGKILKADAENELDKADEKEKGTQYSEEDKKTIDKLNERLKKNLEIAEELKKQIKELENQLDRLENDLKSFTENTQRDIEKLQKEIDKLNNQIRKQTFKDTLKGNLVDQSK